MKDLPSPSMAHNSEGPTHVKREDKKGAQRKEITVKVTSKLSSAEPLRAPSTPSARLGSALSFFIFF